MRIVSIHAPAWGATRFHRLSRVFSYRFNSRSRMGSDYLPIARPTRATRFNSRSRMGSDFPPRPLKTPKRVSIHAPAWGATSVLTAVKAKEGGFNSRSRMGSDRI